MLSTKTFLNARRTLCKHSARQGPSCCSCQQGLGLEYGLDLQVQLDLVGDYDAAAFDRRVVGHAEVAAVDLALRGEASAGAAVRILAEAVELELQRYLAGDAL